ncbi:UDP-N-acetylmuramoyl-L-alanyl-D-glutamate--2,6-diaminopimelate ligase [Microbacterium sp. APC 3898]|uniref:UDP-N-acetylmuramyl-tripeptide synthetase n=1 Tax=Planococcus notacanthi TaxID=3035188 RepID=A0ABT7ZLW7_9BACL|nr:MULTISPECIES: UDP-N-acetylmuramoyl-L-alanyl-D-glutamate--2,6-diaminopimelate ligase [Terrabacteria group]MDN3428160.1 UDP-N-acetylmuramoyl-L-alanyl-D-glutamate--2,6-diaminopimelate ligase [Planococcus sp. APC 4016]MDN3498303.1 UDP-N-acetylmuramoyl-L-alanyl-D-glutamate--2,6-diaminopimelate ligase [Microbacterium sp. APC 3898]
MEIPFASIPSFHIIAQYGPDKPEISSIAYNSRQVVKGCAFFCVPGENTDGHLYIDEAILNGASMIIGSNPVLLADYAEKHPDLSFAVVENVRLALACLADFFYQSPQTNLLKIGVTGTNGKTTTATYVYNLFNLLGVSCGFIGTTGILGAAGKMPFQKSTPTTPISSDIHQIFRKFVTDGIQAVAMEVSSIALDQKRVEGIRFDVAIHTNISEEHLEYHKTFEHYLQSKLLLFKQSNAAVVNIDDEGMSKEILETIDYPHLTYSSQLDSGADLIWTACESSDSGLDFELRYQGQGWPVHVPLYGEYNAANLTAAVGTALLSGIELVDILAVLPKMSQVEGRFQMIHGPGNRKIVLDYAHTPVALAAVLQEVKKLSHNRLIALIAGIGIRDFSKMPKMAKAAEGKADILVVTVDHPGHNEPALVIDAVLEGLTIPYKQQVLTANSRREAVLAALKESGPGDLILLSSGSINGAQIVRGEYIPHSDEAIIEEFFSSKNSEF